MFVAIYLFLKLAVFFIGITFISAYLIHRLLFIQSRKSLIKLFPEAFEKCFALVTDFIKIIEGSNKEEIDRFLTQIVTRKQIDLPKKFAGMPSEIVKESYSALKKSKKDFKKDPAQTMGRIRAVIFQRYLQRYEYKNLNESLSWFLTTIPVAFTTGILLPLLFYFYLPEVLNHWPILLSFLGLILIFGSGYLIYRDYYVRG